MTFQDIIKGRMKGTEEILLGLSSQLAEREDHIFVEDVRSECQLNLQFLGSGT